MRNKKHLSSVVLAKKSSIIATEIALAMMAAQFAYAQQQTEVAAAERVERVEITGTRLPALSVEGPSPVTVMNAQEIRMDGLTKTEDLLNNLPQVYAAQGTAASNGASGTANVNLRNLGVNRNLVLVNGRRLPPGSPSSGADQYAADLNQIPAPLIQRVEMLTGGASAVYGSDAMSGVVNFIMNDRFEGLQIDYNHSFNNHKQQNKEIQDILRTRALTNPSQFQVPDDVTSDGKINSISLLMGRNFADNKGNATVYLGYKREDPVFQAHRDFSACALGGTAGFTCAGSGTSFPGQFLLNGGNGPALTVLDAAGNTRPYSGATDTFNFGPYNYFRRPSQQYSFNAFAHLDVAPSVRAYTELGFHDNHTDAQIAPSGSFFTQQRIFFENPLLSPDWRTQMGLTGPGTFHDILLGRRNVEGGGRDDDIRHTSFRMVAGAKGEVFKHWNYDVFTQVGKVLYQDTYRNDFSKIRINRALDVVTDPGTGQPACRTALPDAAGIILDPLCRPWNIWRLGGVSGQAGQDALNYLQLPGLQNGRTEQEVQGLSLSADLAGYGIKLPGAKSGVAVAFGLERRREKLELETDVSFTSDDLAGQGGATIGAKGSLYADEIFGEVRVPILEGRPLADLLSVNASYRHSEYSTNKNTNTYGVGAEWAPVRNYRFRGSYQHAVRHANITELFQPQSNNLFDMAEDPCGPAMSATLAECQRTGITPAQYGAALLDNPAGQYNFKESGNANLTPEEANTFTLGLVFTPTRNLTGTIDWYSIKITDAIDAKPAETVLMDCLNNNQQCSLITRDSLGTLWVLPSAGVATPNENIGGYHTSGIDLALNYTQRMGALGGFGLHFLGTYVNKWEFEPIKGAGAFDCVGLYGGQCGTPNPRWRHKIRASWQTPWSTDLALTWRHIDKVNHEGTSGDPLLSANVAPVDRTLGARDYIDIAAQVIISKTFTLRGGINNLFDRDPPVVTNAVAGPSIFGNGNTFPQVYDSLGRLIFVNVTAKF